MPGRVEVIDDVEPRDPGRPIDGRDVEQEIEGELGGQAARGDLHGAGRYLDHEHAARHLRLAGRCKFPLHQIQDRRGHDQKVAVMIGCFEPAIRSCSFMIASMTVSGRGGHPGT